MDASWKTVTQREPMPGTYSQREGFYCPSFQTGKPRIPQLTLGQLLLKRVRGWKWQSGVPHLVWLGQGKQLVSLANIHVPVSPVPTQHTISPLGKTKGGGMGGGLGREQLSLQGQSKQENLGVRITKIPICRRHCLHCSRWPTGGSNGMQPPSLEVTSRQPQCQVLPQPAFFASELSCVYFHVKK